MADNADSRTERTVTIAGVEHTLLLSDEDAKRLGAQEDTEVDSKSSTPANKSRTAK